jgi:hypothetical protein
MELNWIDIVGLLFGIYEVLSRVIPTNKTWSIIGKVINVLYEVSQKLDKKKDGETDS